MGIDAVMFARTREEPTERQVRRWSYEAGVLFGHQYFRVRGLHNSDSATWPPQRAFGVTYKILEMEAEPGEWFVEANIRTRYWGPGYERGDFAFILALAEWLELRVPGASVWYGGDTCGCSPFGEQRATLMRHAVEHGCPYRTDSSLSMWAHSIEVPMCTFCEEPMVLGAVKNSARPLLHFDCPGCGDSRVVDTQRGNQ